MLTSGRFHWSLSILAIGIIGAISVPAAAADIIGNVTYIADGDTFDVNTSQGAIRIRLCGVDSPERGEKNYMAAKDALSDFIAGKEVRCVPVGEGTVCDGCSRRTNRGRVVAQCFLEGSDVATLMIKAQLACDWPQFSRGYYQNVGTVNVCVRGDALCGAKKLPGVR
jgi:endonuclease YncB( thermonuclease family)